MHAKPWGEVPAGQCRLASCAAALLRSPALGKRALVVCGGRGEAAGSAAFTCSRQVVLQQVPPLAAATTHPRRHLPDGRSPSPPSPLPPPQDRNCYCTPAVWGAPVDCGACRCTGCPRPQVADLPDDDDCAADRVPEAPYYLSLQGTCER